MAIINVTDLNSSVSAKFGDAIVFLGDHVPVKGNGFPIAITSNGISTGFYVLEKSSTYSINGNSLTVTVTGVATSYVDLRVHLEKSLRAPTDYAHVEGLLHKQYPLQLSSNFKLFNLGNSPTYLAANSHTVEMNILLESLSETEISAGTTILTLQPEVKPRHSKVVHGSVFTSFNDITPVIFLISNSGNVSCYHVIPPKARVAIEGSYMLPPFENR